MKRKWWLGLVAAPLLIAAFVAIEIGAFYYHLACDPWIPPDPATAEELAILKARFPAARENLERAVRELQERRRSRMHDTTAGSDEILAHELSEARRDEELKRSAIPWFQGDHRPPADQDSLIHFTAWAKRGVGFDADWAGAGYVWSPSRRPGDAVEALGGPWYLYSRVDPH